MSTELSKKHQKSIIYQFYRQSIKNLNNKFKNLNKTIKKKASMQIQTSDKSSMQIQKDSMEELKTLMNELQVYCTGSTVSVDRDRKVQWQTEATVNLADVFLADVKWVRISSKSNEPMKLIYKIVGNDMQILFLEHAGNNQYGVFKPQNVNLFTNLLKTLKNKAILQGLKVETIGMLGCEVTEQLKKQVQSATGLRILTLPHQKDSLLQFCRSQQGGKFIDFIYWNQKKEKIYTDKLDNITKYMT